MGDGPQKGDSESNKLYDFRVSQCPGPDRGTTEGPNIPGGRNGEARVASYMGMALLGPPGPPCRPRLFQEIFKILKFRC